MSPSLAEHLKQARHARFVGRDGELNLFSSAVRADHLPFFVLHVFGFAKGEAFPLQLSCVHASLHVDGALSTCALYGG